MDYYKQDLLAMKDEDLYLAEREKKQQCLKLIDYLTQVKVVDASILMKLYDLYRYKL